MGEQEQAERIDELARTKLQMKTGHRKELKGLPERLDEGEDVITLAGGTVGSKNGIIAVTDRRVLFYEKGMMRSHEEEFSYARISSIESSSGMMSGKLRIFASGNKAEITNVIPKSSVQEIVDIVRARISGAGNAAPPVAPAGDDRSPGERLRQLQELKDDGLISEEEFAQRRATLLEDL